MSQGRGSAMVAVAVALCLLVVSMEVADAAVFKVGGAGGWTFNTAGWPKGKRFRAGDTLVFNYARQAHNVVAVSRAGYNKCIVPARSKTFTSGRDSVKLAKGVNYFICSIPGHCQSGMKIAVLAA